MSASHQLRPRRFSLSIELKATITITLLITLICVSLSILFIYQGNTFLKGFVKRRVYTIARKITMAFEYGILTQNPAMIDTMMKSLAAETDIIYAAAAQYDKENSFYWHGKSAPQLDTTRERLSKSLFLTHIDEDIFLQDFILEHPAYTIIMPIKVPAEDVYSAEDILFADLTDMERRYRYIGNVTLSISIANILSLLNHMKMTALVFMVVTILFGAFLTIILIKISLKPLKNLSKATTQIAEGNYNARLPVTSSDEIGRLIESFNVLVDNVRESKEIIESNNVFLEERIRERTQELQDTHQQLLQAAKLSAIGQLAAGVAHELNNPLSGVIGYLQFSIQKLQGLLNDKKKHPPELDNILNYLSMVEKECQRIREIVQSLLDYSRISRQNFHPVSVTATAEDSIKILDYQCKLKNITISLNTRNHIPQVMASKKQLSQVFTNMLMNSMNAMEKGGRITVSARVQTIAEKDFVCTDITDTGCGIDKKYLDRIFDPFFTTKGETGGTGLGLLICYKIIRNFGGDIRVTSTKGVGTTFTVMLPVPETDQAEDA